MAKPIQIKNEEDAWKSLRQLVEEPGVLFADESRTVQFRGWPKFRIRIPKTDKQGAITPTTMSELLDIQQALLRAYSIVRYNSTDTRRLSKDEREALEFSVVVRRGSSKYEIDLQQILERIIDASVGNMTSEHILIAVIVLGLLFFGRAAYAQYLENRLEKRRLEVKSDEAKAQLEQVVFLSKQETERMKVMATAFARSDAAKEIAEEADEAHGAMLRVVERAEGGTVQGVAVTAPIASELVTNARRNGEDITVNGTFEITRVDTTPPAGGFLVRLQRLGDGLILNAGVQDDLLSADHKVTIRDAEWAKIPIVCTIKARRVGGTITKAVITDVQAAPPPAKLKATA